MANNYCQFSAWMNIPHDKIDKARSIIEKAEEEIEKNDNYVGCLVDIEEYAIENKPGIWFHEEESGSPEHVAQIAEKLVNELEIDEPFFCSWAYTCSKPRIDEFGGGAFAVKRGQDTYWIDAMNHALNHVREHI